MRVFAYDLTWPPKKKNYFAWKSKKEFKEKELGAYKPKNWFDACRKYIKGNKKLVVFSGNYAVGYTAGKIREVYVGRRPLWKEVIKK